MYPNKYERRNEIDGSGIDASFKTDTSTTTDAFSLLQTGRQIRKAMLTNAKHRLRYAHPVPDQIDKLRMNWKRQNVPIKQNHFCFLILLSPQSAETGRQISRVLIIYFEIKQSRCSFDQHHLLYHIPQPLLRVGRLFCSGHDIGL